MPRTLFPEFRDEQRDSNYPFGDACTLRSTDNLFFDPGLFLDAVLYPTGSPERLAITSITTSYSAITIYIGNDAAVDLLQVTYDPLSAPDTLTVYQGDRIAGMLLPDSTLLATLQSWPTGSHAFATGEAEFVPSVTIPLPDVGVTGFQLDNGDVISGDVWLVGADGIVFTVLDGDTIRVDVVGDPLFRRRLCEAAGFVTANYGKTINNIPPDEYGDFKIIVGTQLNASPALRVWRDPFQSIRWHVIGSPVATRSTAAGPDGTTFVIVR